MIELMTSKVYHVHKFGWAILLLFYFYFIFPLRITFELKSSSIIVHNNVSGLIDTRRKGAGISVYKKEGVTLSNLYINSASGLINVVYCISSLFLGDEMRNAHNKQN